MADLKKRYKEFKKVVVVEDEGFLLSDEDALRYQDVLCLMEGRGYIRNLHIDNVNYYVQMAKWDGFEEWLYEEIREEKHLSRREWAIGIVCAIIGAAIGLIPYIATLLSAAN